MTIEYIRYKIADDKAEAFVAAYARAGKLLSDSPHCLGYELARCSEEPALFILRIVWDSVEGHLNGFRKSPEFATFLAEIKPYFSDILEMQHYELTAVQAQL